MGNGVQHFYQIGHFRQCSMVHTVVLCMVLTVNYRMHNGVSAYCTVYAILWKFFETHGTGVPYALRC